MPVGDRSELRNKLLMFSFFLLIAIIIWLLNAMGKNYSTVIDYPVTYTDMPDQNVLVGEMPEQLKLRVDAHGYALLRYKLIGKPQPIVFKVSSFAMNRIGNDSTRTYILTRYIREQVSRQLPPELQLLEIKPDSLLFHFARLKSKSVPVKSTLRFTVDKQFTIKDDIIFIPDSVKVSGPDYIIDTISRIRTRNEDLGLLSRSYKGSIRLEKIENVDLSTSRVDCRIELERFTELQFYVPIKALNVPDSIIVQTFPSAVRVTCNVGLSQYDRLDRNIFSATVDYSEISEGKNTLTVHLKNVPVYVRSFNYTPGTVEFLLTEK